MKSSRALKSEAKNNLQKDAPIKRDSTFAEKDETPLKKLNNFTRERNLGFKYSMTLSHLDLN
jgi:hypothetical protein